MGDQAWVRMPRSAPYAWTLALLEVGVQLDLVDRRHDVAVSSSEVRWSTMKLLTPMARTSPSASSVSRARYAARVPSVVQGLAGSSIGTSRSSARPWRVA